MLKLERLVQRYSLSMCHHWSLFLRYVMLLISQPHLPKQHCCCLLQQNWVIPLQSCLEAGTLIGSSAPRKEYFMSKSIVMSEECSVSLEQKPPLLWFHPVVTSAGIWPSLQFSLSHPRPLLNFTLIPWQHLWAQCVYSSLSTNPEV